MANDAPLMPVGPTPFDDHAALVAENGYHGHRGQNHSDIISRGILQDLRDACPQLREELDRGEVGCWFNQKVAFGEGTWAADMVVAEPANPPDARPLHYPDVGAALPGVQPDWRKLRLVIEHKSVITAHRNRNARYRELNTDIANANSLGQDVIFATTILVGTALEVMNVVDGIRKLYKIPGKDKVDEARFDAEVGQRLRAKDRTIWTQFQAFISRNKLPHPGKTVEFFTKNLPERPPNVRKGEGLNALLCVLVYYDNVGTAYVNRAHPLGQAVDADYKNFVSKLSHAYRFRWSRTAR